MSNTSAEVSAVVPTYNRRPFIGRAIDSILCERDGVTEVVVVDDGSSDGTAEYLARRYGSRVRIVQQPNGGVAAARHRGIREATGEWVAFLDSDDEWRKGRMGCFQEAIREVPRHVAWIFGDTEVVTDAGVDGTLFRQYSLVISAGTHVFDDALRVQFPFQFGLLQSSVIRRDALLAMNCFSEPLRSDEDLLASFKVASRFGFAAINTTVTRLYRTQVLRDSSLVFNGMYSPDHYRARMLAFGIAADSSRDKVWGRRHSDAVRGLCLQLASEGKSVRKLAVRQFRHAWTAKGLMFLLAAWLAPPAMRVWTRRNDAKIRQLREECSA